MNLELLFQNLIKKKKLTHSYLFFGFPPLAFVRCLAGFLERKKWEQLNRPLSDCLEVGIRKRAGQQTIGVGDIKIVREFLWRAPTISQRRLAVIGWARQLTTEAQNALLKIAEDAPPHALLVILAKDPAVLVPALASRLQKVYFPPLPTIDFGGEKKGKEFLSLTPRQRSAKIREAAPDEECLTELVKEIMEELAEKPVANFRPLKELCYRWRLINCYNTNKRLQLEAWLGFLNG